jgi:hypothetical protein
MLTERFDPTFRWLLLYTKPHAEAWACANLVKQGFAVLLPRVALVRGREFGMLFPRYLFVGAELERPTSVLRSTYGVAYIVRCGESPAIVPPDVIAEIAGRMDARGVVHLSAPSPKDPLFAKRERERVHALVKFAEAGFRVRLA